MLTSVSLWNPEHTTTQHGSSVKQTLEEEEAAGMKDLGGSLFPTVVATMLLHLGDLEPGTRVADATHLSSAAPRLPSLGRRRRPVEALSYHCDAAPPCSPGKPRYSPDRVLPRVLVHRSLVPSDPSAAAAPPLLGKKSPGYIGTRLLETLWCDHACLHCRLINVKKSGRSQTSSKHTLPNGSRRCLESNLFRLMNVKSELQY